MPPPAMLALLSLLPLSASFLAAQNAPKQRPPDHGWVQLFNGQDLAGWVEVGHEKWEVVDGAIHGLGITNEYGYLRTEKKYQDFQMSIRFKCLADGNSGVYFRCDFEPGASRAAYGLQFEIDRRPRHTGCVFGVGTGWIVLPAAEHETVMRPNDWNDFFLRVEGNRYVARLNGVVVVDFTDPSPRPTDGYIALQLHMGGRGNMLFKDIYVRDLSRR